MNALFKQIPSPKLTDIYFQNDMRHFDITFDDKEVCFTDDVHICVDSQPFDDVHSIDEACDLDKSKLLENTQNFNERFILEKDHHNTVLQGGPTLHSNPDMKKEEVGLHHESDVPGRLDDNTQV